MTTKRLTIGATIRVDIAGIRMKAEGMEVGVELMTRRTKAMMMAMQAVTIHGEQTMATKEEVAVAGGRSRL